MKEFIKGFKEATKVIKPEFKKIDWYETGGQFAFIFWAFVFIAFIAIIGIGLGLFIEKLI